MFIDFLLAAFNENRERDAIVWKDEIYPYNFLLERIHYWRGKIQSEAIPSGTVTPLEADFSPNSIALFLALIEHGSILVPLTASVEARKPEFIKIAQGEVSLTIDAGDRSTIEKLPHCANHEFYQKLRQLRRPGLVLFSSGSTGKSKAVVHDFVRLLEKFKDRRNRLRTITFLLYDHIGGVNTMLYTLSNGGCIVTVQVRSPGCGSAGD